MPENTNTNPRAATSLESDDYYFTRVDLTDATRDRLLENAREWAADLGALRGSIEAGDGNVAGRFGELVFTELFGGEICDAYDYDIRYNGLTIDVKTKRRTVPPQPEYEASIADWNPDQSCDLYYFASVLGKKAAHPFESIWLCGYCPPDEYKAQSTFHEAGEYEPDNDFVFSADCYNLPYAALTRYSGAPSSVTL